MKLHLPQGLRTSLLACLAAFAGVGSTLSTATIAGGVFTFTMASVAEATDYIGYYESGSKIGCHLPDSTDHVDIYGLSAEDSITFNGVSGWLPLPNSQLLNAELKLEGEGLTIADASSQTYTLAGKMSGNGPLTISATKNNNNNNFVLDLAGDISGYTGAISMSTEDRKLRFTNSDASSVQEINASSISVTSSTTEFIGNFKVANAVSLVATKVEDGTTTLAGIGSTISGLTVESTGTLAVADGADLALSGTTAVNGTLQQQLGGSIVNNGALNVNGVLSLASAMNNVGSLTLGENATIDISAMTAENNTYTLFSGEGTINGLDVGKITGIDRTAYWLDLSGNTLTISAISALTYSDSSLTWQDGATGFDNGGTFSQKSAVSFVAPEGSTGTHEVQVTLGGDVESSELTIGEGVDFSLTPNGHTITAGELLVEGTLTLKSAAENAAISASTNHSSADGQLIVQLDGNTILEASSGLLSHYTGNVTVQEGVLQVGGSHQYDSLTVVDGAQLRVNGTYAGAVTLGGDGVEGAGKTDNHYGALKLVNGTLSGPVTIAEGGASITVWGSGSTLDGATINGELLGSGTLTKVHNGTLKLLGNVSHTGKLVVDGGTLQFGENQSSSNTLSSSEIVVKEGATFYMAHAGANFGSTAVTLEGGTFHMQDGDAANINFGTLTVSNKADGSAAKLHYYYNGKLVFDTLTGAGNLNIDVNQAEQLAKTTFTNVSHYTGTVTVETGTNKQIEAHIANVTQDAEETATFTGPTKSSALSKSGDGTIRLADHYASGTINVTGGTVEATTLHATSNLNLTGGATAGTLRGTTLSVESGTTSFGTGDGDKNAIDFATIHVDSGATFKMHHGDVDLANTTIELDGGTLYGQDMASAGLTFDTLKVLAAGGSISYTWGGKFNADILTGAGDLAVSKGSENENYVLSIGKVLNYSGTLTVADETRADTNWKLNINNIHQDATTEAGEAIAAGKIVGHVTGTAFTKTGDGSFTIDGNLTANSVDVSAGTLTVSGQTTINNNGTLSVTGGTLNYTGGTTSEAFQTGQMELTGGRITSTSGWFTQDVSVNFGAVTLEDANNVTFIGGTSGVGTFSDTLINKVNGTLRLNFNTLVLEDGALDSLAHSADSGYSDDLNGFASGTYYLVDGRDSETANTVDFGLDSASQSITTKMFTFEGEEYTATSANGSVTFEVHDLETYHINSGTVTYNGTAESGIGSATHISLNHEGVVLNMVASLNTAKVTGGITVANNATIALGGEGVELAASSLSVSAGAHATLTGTGKLTIGSVNDGGNLFSLSNGGISAATERLDFSSADWTGTVSFGAVSIYGLQLDTFGNADSYVEFNGTSGMFSQANDNNPKTYHANIILTGTDNGGTGTALTLNNGWGGDSRTFAGALSGKGDIVRMAKGSGQSYTFTGDVSEWTGEFKHTGVANTHTTSLTFSGNAQEINADITTSTAGLSVEFSNDKSVEVNGNITGSATTVTYSGNGVKTVNSTGSTYGGGTTISGGEVKLMKTGALGTGMVTVHDGATVRTTVAQNNSFTLMGGTIAIEGNRLGENGGTVTLTENTSSIISGKDAALWSAVGGTGNLTLKGDSNWLHVYTNATFTGDLTLESGQINLGHSGNGNNKATIANTGNVSLSGAEVHMNKKSDGTATTIANSGTVTISAGSLEVNDGTSVCNGAGINIAGGVVTVNNGGSLSNDGVINITNGSLTLATGGGINHTGKANGAVAVAGGALTVNDGATFTTNTLTVSGGAMTANTTLTLGGLTITSGSLTLNAGSSIVGGADFALSVSGTGKLVLSDLSVLGENAGVAGYSDAGGNGYSQTLYTLTSGLTGTTTASGQVTVGTGESAPSYALTASGSSITFAIRDADDAGYYVNASASYGAANSGQISTATSVVIADGKTLTIQSASALSESAKVTAAAGSTTTGVVLDGVAVDYTSELETYTGDVTVKGSQGKLSLTAVRGFNSITVKEGATLDLTADYNKALILNNGKVTLDPGSLGDYANVAAGSITLQSTDANGNETIEASEYSSNTIKANNSSMYSAVSGTGHLTLNNAATHQGAQVFYICSTVAHTGDLTLQGSELSVTTNNNKTGQIQNTGNVYIGGTIAVESGSFISNDGTVSMSSGSLTLKSGGGINHTGKANGAVTVGTGSLTVNDGATFKTGLLTISGGTMTANETLTLGGLTITSGSLTVDGAITGTDNFSMVMSGGTFILTDLSALGDGVESFSGEDGNGLRQTTYTLISATNSTLSGGEAAKVTVGTDTYQLSASTSGITFSVAVAGDDGYYANDGDVSFSDATDAGATSVVVDGGNVTVSASDTVGAGAIVVKDDATITLDGNATLNSSSLQVENGAKVTVSGESGTYIVDSTIAPDTPDAPSTTTVSEKISGGLSVTYNGTGTTEITGEANDYTGGTTISGGTVVAKTDNALGSGTVTVENEGTALQLDGNTLTNTIETTNATISTREEASASGVSYSNVQVQAGQLVVTEGASEASVSNALVTVEVNKSYGIGEITISDSRLEVAGTMTLSGTTLDGTTVSFNGEALDMSFVNIGATASIANEGSVVATLNDNNAITIGIIEKDGLAVQGDSALTGAQDLTYTAVTTNQLKGVELTGNLQLELNESITALLENGTNVALVFEGLTRGEVRQKNRMALFSGASSVDGISVDGYNILGVDYSADGGARVYLEGVGGSVEPPTPGGAIPEPATATLSLLALAALAARRRRK